MTFGARLALSMATVLLVSVALADQVAPRDGGSKDLVELMNLLSRPQSVSARFMERKELSVLSEPVIAAGTLHYERGGRIERYMTSPYEERFIIDGETLTIENVSQGGVRSLALVDHPVLEAFVESFRAMLSGDLTGLQEHHEITMVGDIGSWMIRLKPRNPDLSDKVESIRFSGSGSSILAIEIKESGGNSSLMTIVPDPG